MEIPDYYKDVSKRLIRVLDTAGLGEDARWKRINMWLQCEGLEDMVFVTKCEMSVHVFGSQAEATTTMMLNADIDFVYYRKNISVLQDLQNWRHGTKIFLMIIDDTTFRRYVKLQAVLRDQPIAVSHVQNSHLMLNRYGQSVLRNSTAINKVNTDDEQCGPATTTIK
ncbi:hypothetical protein CHS0354_017463 [Potamilus streckersoni]|uniref:Uncharacterized protein n=1 Tax=Potamilus streckersoni TaxID=2493646 RepID=A0AAE0RXV0_9BIVA|nr:hypothetical protein CHS0354_017463 [Potamilus streckersoni]